MLDCLELFKDRSASSIDDCQWFWPRRRQGSQTNNVSISVLNINTKLGWHHPHLLQRTWSFLCWQPSAVCSTSPVLSQPRAITRATHLKPFSSAHREQNDREKMILENHLTHPLQHFSMYWFGWVYMFIVYVAFLDLHSLGNETCCHLRKADCRTKEGGEVSWRQRGRHSWGVSEGLQLVQSKCRLEEVAIDSRSTKCHLRCD